MSTRAESLHTYLRDARWFGGKGREFKVSDVRRLGTVPGRDTPPVVVDLVELTYDDGSTELYQIPMTLITDPDHGLDHAFVGWWEDDEHGWVHAYDAVHDRESMSLFLRAFAAPSGADEALNFIRVPEHELDLDVTPALFSGEQSNSSVLFGEDSILKVFRKITRGENPDITTHRALTEAGSTHIAALYGWIEAQDDDGSPLHLAMLQQFLRTASDGWETALASVRDLFSEADLHADEVGGDFAAEASRLGTALAEVHAQLRDAFGTSTLDARVVAAQMNERLDQAVDVVPELAEHADRLRGAYAALADLGEFPVQRIHGDLHLGQTLRTIKGWKLVDFEGEPAKPLAERMLPDSPWRDVAGMLRSFDYAPHAMARSMPEDDPDVLAQREHRADEWAARNKAAFLAAYAGPTETAGVDPAAAGPISLSDEEGVQVAAYVADKTVYECVYEARNRPSWLQIPLAAVARVGTP
jgi:maltokinase